MAISAPTTGKASLQQIQRPAGITFLAILNFIWGTLLGAACALLIFIVLKPTSAVDSWGLRNFFAGIGILVAMICFGLAALHIGMGFAFLRLKNWARRVTFVMVVVNLVYVLRVIAGVLSGIANIAIAGSRTLGAYGLAGARSVLMLVAVSAFDVWVLVYLSRPHARNAFAASGQVAKPRA
jgi:hypothetical protein